MSYDDIAMDYVEVGEELVIERYYRSSTRMTQQVAKVTKIWKNGVICLEKGLKFHAPSRYMKYREEEGYIQIRLQPYGGGSFIARKMKAGETAESIRKAQAKREQEAIDARIVQEAHARQRRQEAYDKYKAYLAGAVTMETITGTMVTAQVEYTKSGREYNRTVMATFNTKTSEFSGVTYRMDYVFFEISDYNPVYPATGSGSYESTEGFQDCWAYFFLNM